MWETMAKADGVGLAAPQIGQSIRLFVIDGSGFTDKDPSMKDFKKTFINAQILDESGENFTFNEGCLSVPGIREDVVRKSKIKIRYQDENFNEYEEEYDGLKARIIQHEYDHLQGKMLIDHINPLKRRMLQGKLNNISKGKVTCDYKFKILK
jgi:peptide deformylase